jgi:GNAT superfamily N-acetyltransferase
MEPRPYCDPADFERLKTLLIEGRKANNGTYYVHVGDVQWWLYYPDATAEFGERIWFWADGGQVLGVCVLAPVQSAYDVFVRPDLRGTPEAEAMEQWAEARLLAQGVTHVKVDWIAKTDAVRCERFEARGYKSDDSSDLNYYVQALQAVPEPQLPEGYSIRATLGEAELEERALASYAAFKSKWAMDKYLERRLSFMRSPGFVRERDRVVVSAAGRVASFCIYWVDPVNKVGLFEPVGTHPDFQGKGLGKALLLDTLRRMQAEGMETANVCAEAKNPAANRLYQSVGFTQAGRFCLYEKDL